MINIKDSIFYEKINYKKLRYIFNNRIKYEDIINKEELDMRRAKSAYNAFDIFERNLNNCIVTPDIESTEYAYIKVKYNKSGNLSNGRWYTKGSIGLAPLCKSVRHTICDDSWIDIDQVNSHPTILFQLLTKHNLHSISLKACINKREKFLNVIAEELNTNRDDAKSMVIAVINGGSHRNSPNLIEFQNQINPFIDIILNLPEYEDILQSVKKEFNDKKSTEKVSSSNFKGKAISRVLQTIENTILECHVDFFYKKGMINKVKNAYEVVLIFDGLQISSNHDVTDELLAECRKHTNDTIGYDIELKIKPFDNPLILPENYNSSFDEIPDIISKFNNYAIEFYDNHIKFIDKIIKNYTDHDTFELISKFCTNRIIYDDDSNMWFYINNNNIWIESKNPGILNQLIPTIIHSFFQTRNKHYIEIKSKVKILKDETDPLLKTYGIKENESIPEFLVRLKNACINSAKCMNNLKSTSIKQKIPHHKELFQKNKFKKDFLDSNGHLFAFSDKLFDFSVKVGDNIKDYMRNILPTDYIQSNTGYPFPQNINQDDIDFIQNYLNDLFPDIEKKQYVLDSFSTSMNGANNEQSLNIHKGRGSNSKSTIMDLFSCCFGNYSVNISPETFTQAKKANSNGELYKLKGKRLVISNEPDDDNGNRLQTSILKTIADEGNSPIIAKEMYKNPIEFKNQASLNLCMNNTPSLSTVDGGIARRIRIIEYDTIYVLNPKFPNERKLDPTIKKIMNGDNIRDTTIIELLKNWIINVKVLSKIYVPQCVLLASQEYIIDSNIVLKFFSETEDYIITEKTTHRVKSSDLFIAFKIWVKNNKSDETMSDKKFKDYMLNIPGITQIKNSCMWWCGIKENSEEKLQDIADGPESSLI